MQEGFPRMVDLASIICKSRQFLCPTHSCQILGLATFYFYCYITKRSLILWYSHSICTVLTFSSLSKSLSFPEIATSMIDSTFKFFQISQCHAGLSLPVQLLSHTEFIHYFSEVFLNVYLHTSLAHFSLCFSFSTPQCRFPYF